MKLIDVDALESEVLYEEDYDYDYDENPIESYQPVEAVRLSEIKSAPTIDAELVRHGHWVSAYPDIEPNPMFMYGICSVCGFEQGLSNKFNYCPNCGAKMNEANE